MAYTKGYNKYLKTMNNLLIKKVKKIRKEGSKLQHEVRKKLVKYIAAGFAFVAGLAWDDAIKSVIEYFFPPGINSILAKFIYALTLTIIAVVITIYLFRIFKNEREGKEENKNQQSLDI